MKTQLPYYSHPLSESTQRRTNLPRRPSVIQPKLSRGQIAKFRNASGGSQISSNSIPISNNRPSQGNTQEASSTGPSYSNHKNLYPPSPADNSFSSSTSTITMKSLNESGSSTPRGNRNKKLPLSPLDTKPRRHLASSRSTAEMKGRSPTTPSSRPSSSKNTPKKSELVSFETSTPRPGYEVRYPFVCPDRLVQRPHPHQREKEVLSPTFMRPRPAPRPPGYVEDRSSPELADIMSYQTTSPTPPSPTPPPVPAPVDSETLERLFNEVLQACRTGDIPFSPTNSGESVYSGQTSYMSPEQVSRQSRYSAETFRSPGESSGESFYSPEAITPHVRRTGAPWSPSFEFDVDADADSDEAHVARSPSFPTAPNARPSTQGRKPEVEVPKRFIPSGRSFEPLRAINVQNTGTMTDSRRDEQWKGSVKRGKVREAVAKFENVAANSATPPTTPIRGEYWAIVTSRTDGTVVIGEILDRPTLADSHGLSEESRRLSMSTYPCRCRLM